MNCRASYHMFAELCIILCITSYHTLWKLHIAFLYSFVSPFHMALYHIFTWLCITFSHGFVSQYHMAFYQICDGFAMWLLVSFAIITSKGSVHTCAIKVRLTGWTGCHSLKPRFAVWNRNQHVQTKPKPNCNLRFGFGCIRFNRNRAEPYYGGGILLFGWS